MAWNTGDVSSPMTALTCGRRSQPSTSRLRSLDSPAYVPCGLNVSNRRKPLATTHSTWAFRMRPSSGSRLAISASGVRSPLSRRSTAAQIFSWCPAFGHIVSNRNRPSSCFGPMSLSSIWPIPTSAPLWPESTTPPGVGAFGVPQPFIAVTLSKTLAM